jgi:hypothetical protein
MKKWWKRDWVVPALLILVLAGVGYGFLWRQDVVVYSAHSDFILHGLGAKTVLFKALGEERGIPFWREDQLAGYPAFTNPQMLFTYPLHFLFYFLEPANAIGGTLWLHFVMGALALYMVGAVLGLGKSARLLMAVCALFNFKLVIAAYAGWLPPIASITCFPLLFAATFYLVNQRGLKGILAFCAAVAFCLHTGNLQYIYYAMWFLSIYLLAQGVTWLRTGQRHTLRQVGLSLLCGAILGTGMVAYFLVPLAGEASLISRSEISYSVFVSDHSLTLGHLLTFLHPEAIGNPLDGSYPQVTLWEDVGYFGILQLILATVGTVFGWRKCHTRFFVAFFLLSIFTALDTPFLRLLYNALPGFKLFRCPSRFLFFTAFFGITLAGIGLDEMVSRLRKRWRWHFLGHVLTALVLLIISCEGVFYIRRYLTTVPHQTVLPKTAYEEFFASDKTTFRIATLYGPTINYGWAASMDLQLISGYDPFNFSHYQAYFDLLQWGAIRTREPRHFFDLTQISRADLLDALNVKYLVSPAPLGGPSGRFEQVGHWKNQPMFVFFSGMTQSDIYVYRNNRFLPRAFWVSELVEVEGEEEMIALVKRKRLSHAAIILGSKQMSFSFKDSPEDQVDVLGASGGHLALQTQNRTLRFLGISEVWHPGWRAFIDGEKLQLHRSDVALMGAWIPSGRHKIELRFRPMYWTAAVGISAVSGVVFVILLAIVYRRCWQDTLKPMDSQTSQRKRATRGKIPVP